MSKINTQIRSYWSKQLSEIKKEGWVVVRRKTVTLIVKLLKLPIDFVGYTLAVPIVLIVRLIRPIKLIRFGHFKADRIGHFAIDTEYYLVEKALGIYPVKSIDLFNLYYKPANLFFLKLVKREINIFNWVKYLNKINSLIPGGDNNQILSAGQRYGSRDINGLFNKINPQLDFKKEENNLGIDFLKKLGISNNDKFICLNVRDSAYLPYDSKNIHSFRDSNIYSYKEAAVSLAEKGYWVIRMGKIVNDSFKNINPKIFDYANSELRSDFLDIWLIKNCHFVISTSTGIDSVASIYRKPILLVNHLPIGDMRTGSSKIMEIFKKLRWEKNGKFLTLREQIDIGAIHYFDTNDYTSAGIEIIDNTPEEIRSATIDFEKYTENNSMLTNHFDINLQKNFWKIFSSWENYSTFHGEHKATISNSFLMENQKWLLS